MEGDIHDLADRKSEESSKLGSLGTQINLASFPILPANCLELFVCWGSRRKSWFSVLGKGTGHSCGGRKMWGEERTGLCVLLALESAVGLRCSGGKRKEGGRGHYPRQ